jgi:chromosomal replication initiation ATPase DnaA
MMRQLALPLPVAVSFDARDVIADESNAAARSWLAKPEAWPLGRLALFGEAGLGKTHLARAAAARFGWRWLDGMGLRGLPPPAPQGSVVDDADCVVDEAALLHLVNLCAERGETLLLIGRAPPARWPLRLPDLASRLRATQAVGLGAASDALLRGLLSKFFADRQLRVEPDVQAWLLTRLPRDATGTLLVIHDAENLIRTIMQIGGEFAFPECGIG